MEYDPKDLHSVLLFIKEQYGVESFNDNKIISILKDLAPELRGNTRVLQKLIENELFEILINLKGQDREKEIKRIEKVLKDRNFILPETSDYCVRTVVDVFNEEPEEILIEIEDKTEPLLIKKEEEHSDNEKSSEVLRSVFKDNSENVYTSKYKHQRVSPVLKGLIVLGIILICTITGLIVLGNREILSIIKGSQVTGLIDIVDSDKDYARYLGQDIYTVVSEINSKGTVETDEDVGVYYKSNIGADENFTICFYTADDNRTIRSVYLYDNSDKENDGSNIFGITTGMSKLETEKILRDQGFEVDTSEENLSANKDDYSISVNFDNNVVDDINIFKYSL